MYVSASCHTPLVAKQTPTTNAYGQLLSMREEHA